MFQDLQDVLIGSLFLESSTMFLTFENYCVNQVIKPPSSYLHITAQVGLFLRPLHYCPPQVNVVKYK